MGFGGFGVWGLGFGVWGLRFDIWGTRRVYARLPGKGKSSYLGTRPVHPIITMITWIWTSGLSINNSL